MNRSHRLTVGTAEFPKQQVLTAINDRRYTSMLPTFCATAKTRPGLLSRDQRPDFAQIESALNALKSYMQPSLELRQAVQELVVFVDNLGRLPSDAGIDTQLKMIYPLRWWFRFIPTSFLQPQTTDPWVMVVVAFYYLIALAIDPIMPALGVAYFTEAKAVMIETIGHFLESAADVPLDTAVITPYSMTEMPRSWAREYKEEHMSTEQTVPESEDQQL
ncbi:hypothetical protein LTR86_005839 [Recurvomyces mirabilis]|nr:hypothetical protein LTR86_005839 [Recurvomyces mirabilis]